jgi:hypothetical protein
LTSDYFGKLQSALLICVVYYWPTDATPSTPPSKKYMDFVSSDLDHSSLFYQKALQIVIEDLQSSTHGLTSIYNATDGSSREFYNRYNLYANGIFEEALGTCFLAVSTLTRAQASLYVSGYLHLTMAKGSVMAMLLSSNAQPDCSFSKVFTFYLLLGLICFSSSYNKRY